MHDIADYFNPAMERWLRDGGPFVFRPEKHAPEHDAAIWPSRFLSCPAQHAWERHGCAPVFPHLAEHDADMVRKFRVGELIGALWYSALRYEFGDQIQAEAPTPRDVFGGRADMLWGAYSTDAFYQIPIEIKHTTLARPLYAMYQLIAYMREFGSDTGYLILDRPGGPADVIAMLARPDHYLPVMAATMEPVTYYGQATVITKAQVEGLIEQHKAAYAEPLAGRPPCPVINWCFEGAAKTDAGLKVKCPYFCWSSEPQLEYPLDKGLVTIDDAPHALLIQEW